MFQKRRGRTTVAGPAAPQPPSIVSADMRITGDLETAGEVHVDGSIEGNVRAARVTVGRDGRISGKVETATLEVHGAILGTVQADDVLLFSTARMQGDVVHSRLQVEAGAVVHGMYRRSGAEKTGNAGAPSGAGRPGDADKVRDKGVPAGAPPRQEAASASLPKSGVVGA